MRYYVIRIRPNLAHTREAKNWECTINLEPADRVDERRKPHATGLFICPETKTAKHGFEELKRCMISAHKKEIKDLEDSLQKLRELKFEDVTTW